MRCWHAPATPPPTRARCSRAAAPGCAVRRGGARRGGSSCWPWSGATSPRCWTAPAAELERSRHELEIAVCEPGTRGKFENLNRLLAGRDLSQVDWLLVLDDDVELPRGFLDAFIEAAEQAGLSIAQPAHRFHSHAAWAVTRRRPGILSRTTSFVEIGPVTAFSRETFGELLPFPDLRMGWGLDAHWSALARGRGWAIGVVDATPVGHTLRPAATTYPRAEAVAEARRFLEGRDYVRRGDVRTLEEHRSMRDAAATRPHTRSSR